jgi:L-malate glycosyltransferase
MKILQLVQKPQRRGAEVFAYQLSQWLRGEGHDVRTVYLYEYAGDKRLPLEPGDVALEAREKHLFERIPGAQPALLRRLRAVVRAYDPDVIQVNGARTVKYGALVRLLERNVRWKMVYRNIDSPVFWVRGAIRRFLNRRVFMPQMDGIVGVSRKTLAEVEDLFRPRGESIFIPNGVDLKALQPTQGSDEIRDLVGVPRDAVVALFMGNLTRQKRPDRFLRALKRAREEVDNLYGWLLGDGPDRAALEAQVRSLGLTDRVRFLGYQDQVASYVAAADFYVSTSDTEGIPAVVVEVGYLGKPTLGLRVGGMHECVLHGETGYLVEPGDEDELVRRLVHLARDEQERIRLGSRAHSWSRDTFSIERVASEYREFYRKVLDQRSPGIAPVAVHG